jgi:CheY-like chemotaxis protein
MYAEFLAANGFTTHEVGRTDDALAMAEDVDIVVTGIRVPGTFDGLGLVRALRRGRSTGRVPVIVLTACAFPEDRARAQAAGCHAFIAKPCLPTALVAEIRQQLAAARARAAEAPGRATRKRMAKARQSPALPRQLPKQVKRR